MLLKSRNKADCALRLYLLRFIFCSSFMYVRKAIWSAFRFLTGNCQWHDKTKIYARKFHFIISFLSFHHLWNPFNMVVSQNFRFLTKTRIFWKKYIKIKKIWVLIQFAYFSDILFRNYFFNVSFQKCGKYPGIFSGVLLFKLIHLFLNCLACQTLSFCNSILAQGLGYIDTSFVFNEESNSCFSIAQKLAYHWWTREKEDILLLMLVQHLEFFVQVQIDFLHKEHVVSFLWSTFELGLIQCLWCHNFELCFDWIKEMNVFR